MCKPVHKIAYNIPLSVAAQSSHHNLHFVKNCAFFNQLHSLHFAEIFFSLRAWVVTIFSFCQL